MQKSRIWDVLLFQGKQGGQGSRKQGSKIPEMRPKGQGRSAAWFLTAAGEPLEDSE